MPIPIGEGVGEGVGDGVGEGVGVGVTDTGAVAWSPPQAVRPKVSAETETKAKFLNL
jgi:hypothetical protein